MFKGKIYGNILGYSQNDSKLFHQSVLNSLIGKILTKNEVTQFGIRHTYNTKLISKDKKSVSANLIAVIQMDNSMTI